ncbi:hypothetical protein KW785_00285 [Candidatus Parcubacteria bacterium]|nr:hypothetical protein [Candidatus Parcubacteria bacterium]
MRLKLVVLGLFTAFQGLWAQVKTPEKVVPDRQKLLDSLMADKALCNNPVLVYDAPDASLKPHPLPPRGHLRHVIDVKPGWVSGTTFELGPDTVRVFFQTGKVCSLFSLMHDTPKRAPAKALASTKSASEKPKSNASATPSRPNQPMLKNLAGDFDPAKHKLVDTPALITMGMSPGKALEPKPTPQLTVTVVDSGPLKKALADAAAAQKKLQESLHAVQLVASKASARADSLAKARKVPARVDTQYVAVKSKPIEIHDTVTNVDTVRLPANVDSIKKAAVVAQSGYEDSLGRMRDAKWRDSVKKLQQLVSSKPKTEVAAAGEVAKVGNAVKQSVQQDTTKKRPTSKQRIPITKDTASRQVAKIVPTRRVDTVLVHDTTVVHDTVTMRDSVVVHDRYETRQHFDTLYVKDNFPWGKAIKIGGAIGAVVAGYCIISKDCGSKSSSYACSSVGAVNACPPPKQSAVFLGARIPIP